MSYFKYFFKAANEEPDPDMISSGEALNQNSPISEISELTSNVKINKNYGSYDKIKEINKYLAAQHINKKINMNPKTKAIKPENHTQKNEIGTEKIFSFMPSSNVRDQITPEIVNNTSLSSSTAKVRQASADDEEDGFNKELLSDSGFGESDELNQSNSSSFNNSLARKFKSNTNSFTENFEREKVDINSKNISNSTAEFDPSIESNQTSFNNIFKVGNIIGTMSNNVSSKGNINSTMNNIANAVDAVDEVSKIDRFKALLKISYKPLNDKLSPTKEKQKENEKKKKALEEENVIKSMTEKLKSEKSANNVTSFSVMSDGRPVNHFLTKGASEEVDSRGVESKQLDTVNVTGSGSGSETDFDGDYNTEDEKHDSEIFKKPNLNPMMEKSASIVFQEKANELGHNEGLDKNIVLPGSNNFQNGVYENDSSFNIPLQAFGRKNKKHRHIKIYPINGQSYTNSTELLPEEHSIGNIQTVAIGNIQELSGSNKRRKHNNNSKKKTVHDPEFNLLNVEQENDSNQHNRHLQENHEKIIHSKLFNDTLFEVAGQKANRKQSKLRKKSEGLTFLTNSAAKKLNDHDDLDNDDDASEYDGAYFRIHNVRRRNVDALMMHRRGEIELRRSLKKKGRGHSADWLRKYWGGESEENGGDISLILKKRSEIMQDEVEVPSGIGSNLGYEDRIINATLVTERILSEMNLGESAVEQNEKYKDFGLQDPTLISRENESVLKTDRIKSKENIDRPKHHLNHHPRSKRTEKVRV